MAIQKMMEFPEQRAIEIELPSWLIARQRDPNYGRPDPVYAGKFMRGQKVWIVRGSRVLLGMVIHHLDDRKSVRRVIIDYGDSREILPVDIVLLSARN